MCALQDETLADGNRFSCVIMDVVIQIEIIAVVGGEKCGCGIIFHKLS